MSQDKAERLMNLHIMLLGSKRFISKDAIRAAHYSDYPDDERGDASFERAFERDKDDLRAIGAVIEVGSADAYFEDELGYRIPTEQTSLPEARFTADEAAVLGLAARVWQQATLAKAADSALTKLKALGVEIEPDRLDVLAPVIGADEPAFDALWEASQHRRAVSFDYARPGQAQPERRRLQPWGVVRTSGRWYVVGHDVDRREQRVFRLSRVVGEVKPTGKNWAYEIPEGTDVREVARNLVPPARLSPVTFLVRQGTAVGLRRQAVEVQLDVPGPDRVTGWDRVVASMSEHDAVQHALGLGPDGYVESPDSVRDQVITRLDQALEETR